MGLIKYLMEVFYNSEKYSKYKIGERGRYSFAIIVTSFILFSLFFTMLLLVSTIFPTLQNAIVNISERLPTTLSGIAVTGLLFFFC